jgi:hypothetical protein
MKIKPMLILVLIANNIRIMHTYGIASGLWLSQWLQVWNNSINLSYSRLRWFLSSDVNGKINNCYILFLGYVSCVSIRLYSLSIIRVLFSWIKSIWVTKKTHIKIGTKKRSCNIDSCLVENYKNKEIFGLRSS